MPEGPELRLMADFLNQYKDTECYGTYKSTVTKIVTPDIEDGVFIGAKSRGKELMLEFRTDTDENIKYFFSMGMSGNWQVSSGLNAVAPKHSHFNISLQYLRLHMVDPRRFAKWKIANDWNKDRSPDPLLEPTQWWVHFNEQIAKHKYDKIPIYELLMDQNLFNGVGNYIRAEVLFNMDINPALTHWEIETASLHRAICQVMTEAYSVGGMEIAAFKNPNQIDQPKNKGDWQKCYKKSNMASILDNNGRTFWYNPKYELCKLVTK